MIGQSICPQCAAVTPWRGERPPTSCRECRYPLPVDVQLVQAEPIPEVLPVGQGAWPQIPAPLADEVVKLTRSHRVARYAPAQRLVFALLIRTLQGYRACDWLEVIVGYFLVPVLLLIGVIGSLVVMWAGYWILVVLETLHPQANYLLYLVPVVVIVFARTLKSLAEKPQVKFVIEGGKIQGWRLGRLHDIFHSGIPGSLGLYLGCAFGLQWGLLTFTNDHAGLNNACGLWESFLLAFDNLCHGVFLDVFELYDIHVGPKIEHSLVSATVFNLFRLSFDALVLVLAFVAYQRWRLQRFFVGFPDDARDINSVIDWVEASCAARHRLPQWFFDEIFFLVVTKEYLCGNYDFVSQLSGQLPWLAVKKEVRDLFVLPDGTVTFYGQYTEQ